MPNSPLKYVGGKARPAQRIVAAFPPPETYDIYVETCGGAGNVLLHKPVHQHHTEIYNDLDDNLVAFWREMQTNGLDLRQRLDALLYTRQDFRTYYRSLFDGTPLSQQERALRFFYVLRGTATGWVRKSPVGWNYLGARGYRSALSLFEVIQQRLKCVAIDCRDVLEAIRRYDSPRTLFYIDPPYFGVEFYYEASKHGFPHQEMAQLLQTVKGKVALSYYPHPNIDSWYSAWRRITWQQYKSSQIQIPDRADYGTEMLLCNYAAPALSLWESAEKMTLEQEEPDQEGVA